MVTKNELIKAVLTITDEHGFNTDVMPGYLYAKVLYLMDALEPTLDAREKELIESHGVRRGIEAIAGRSDPSAVPDKRDAIPGDSASVVQKDVPSPPHEVDFFGYKQIVFEGA